jgi:hypothetical protein
MRLLLAIVVGSALYALPVQAQSSGVLGLFGFGGDDKDPIEYLERPPLVVPKGNTLPPPAEFNAKAAAWPRDPDDLAAKQRVIARKKALVPHNKFDDQLAFVRAEQAKKQRKIAQGKGKTSGVECTLFGGCIEPDKPRQGVQPEEQSTVLANGEPRRQYLTDPPTGLRAPAPPPAPGSN